MVDALRQRATNVGWLITTVLDRASLARHLPPLISDGHRRISRYVPVRDGTQIAVDVYRPVRRGAVLEAPLPVIWSFDRYHRARIENGKLWTRLEREPWTKLLIRLGYVVAVADLRGAGASFGTRPGLVLEEDRWDAYDITEWLAAQPWCSGRIGMFGKSFMGLTQFLAASAAPPHLKAIFPEKTFYDLYDFARPGGVFRDDYARDWSANLSDLDKVRPAAPVDADPDGRLLSQAMQEHQANVDIAELFAGLPFRDSRDCHGGLPYRDQSPSRFANEISASGIAILQLAGWHDMWPRDALLWHEKLTNPRRLIIGPWAHTQDSGWRLFSERLAWWDRWLKGQDTGAADSARIDYVTTGAQRRKGWKQTRRWPPEGAQSLRLHLLAASEDATGGLHRQAAPEPSRPDRFTVDYTASSGHGSRWKNGYGREYGYPDMSGNDTRGMVFTSEVLTEDLEVTGHPMVTLWIEASTEDADLFVYLEEVHRNGRSDYVTEGVLRASHRQLDERAKCVHGLPRHVSTAAGTAPLPAGGPSQLRLDLHPISHAFRAGRRIRLAVTGADADNAETPRQDTPPEIAIYCGGNTPSYVDLPVVGAR
jgi:uncharacterized protein